MTNPLRAACDLFSDAPLLVNDNEQSTYADLGREIDDRIAWFRQHGIRPSEVVVVKGDFSFPTIGLLAALIVNGNVVVPQTDVSIDKVWPEIALLAPHWLLEQGDGGFTCTALPVGPGVAWNEFLAPGEPGLIVFTSGTTGRPKAIVHSFDRLLEKFTARQGRSHRTIPFLLFDHMGGINTLLSVMFSGGSIVHERDRTVDALCRAVERHRVTLLPTTPTFLTMMLVSEVWKTYDLSCLQLIT